MNLVDRRSVLKVIGGLTAFIPVAKVLAQSNPINPITIENGELLVSEEQFAEQEKLLLAKYGEGEVTSIFANNIILREPSGAALTLILTESSRIWKGNWENSEPIEVGDRIFAWGERKAQNLMVEQLYSNIVNLQGKIINVKKVTHTEVSIIHDDYYTGVSQVDLNANTEVLDNVSEQIKSLDALQFKNGQFLQVVGLRLKDGTVRATRVFA